MRFVGVAIVGIGGACGFTAGWVFDPAEQTVMIVSLVCGLSGVFGQLPIRELASKAQSLVDRGADNYVRDGGQLLADARKVRDRVLRLSSTMLVFGASAPTLAAVRGIFDLRIWSALALAASMLALLMALLLSRANRAFSLLLEEERTRRSVEQAKQSALDADDPPASETTDPNLYGYGSAEEGRFVQPTKH